MNTSQEPSFESQVIGAFRALQQSLIDIFAAAGVDASRAFPAARELSVNKNLTWKAWKIIRAKSPGEAIDHLPGKAGMKLLLDALQFHGADVATVERTATAVAEFDRLIETHSGDRETLELMLDGLRNDISEDEQLEKSRKLAFRGNSGLWGVQLESLFSTCILAPNPKNPDMLDNVKLTGCLGLKRLRSETPWTLLHMRSRQDDGKATQAKQHDSLDPVAESTYGAPVLARFSTPDLPRFEVRGQDSQLKIGLPRGPVGSQGSADIYFARTARRFAGAYADEHNKIGRFLVDYTLPIRRATFDVLFHKDTPPIEDAEHQLFGMYDGSEPIDFSRLREFALPIRRPIQDLGIGLKGIGSSSFPRYAELLQFVMGKLDWNPDDFRTLRVETDYPPMGSMGAMTFPLKQR